MVKKANSKKIVVGVLLALLALFISAIFYKFAASPASIRNPKLAHYHFRMQIVINGQSEDFSDPSYQVAYDKNQCSVKLPEQPIHFHDNKDQFVHIHWDNMTGGLVMKYYGWNFIGGVPGSLGYRFDEFKKVPLHGKLLPRVPEDSRFYIFEGDANNYRERRFIDWLSLDLETFFGESSSLSAFNDNSLLNRVFQKAYAHGEIKDGHENDQEQAEQENLARLNNLIGNVVIFLQSDKPTDEQIKQRFNNLEPLPESTCAG